MISSIGILTNNRMNFSEEQKADIKTQTGTAHLMRVVGIAIPIGLKKLCYGLRNMLSTGFII